MEATALQCSYNTVDTAKHNIKTEDTIIEAKTEAAANSHMTATATSMASMAAAAMFNRLHDTANYTSR